MESNSGGMEGQAEAERVGMTVEGSKGRLWGMRVVVGVAREGVS